MSRPPRILYCHCAHAQVIPKHVKEEVLRRLSTSGVAFEAVADLCEMSSRCDPALKRMTNHGDGELKIAACYPRAVKWLFSAAGAPLPEQGVEVLNMRERSADEVTAPLLPGEVRGESLDTSGLDRAGAPNPVESVRDSVSATKPGQWKPWFPVIDCDRCTNCMQCLSFCLFDVYGVTPDGRITVKNPENCKTDCPACSRVCPEVAILFPKYKAGPINGDEVKEEDVNHEKMRVDVSALLGGDVYSALRRRGAAAKDRFAKERNDKRALQERRRCLAGLRKDLEIPPEVLDALPSMDHIQEKALLAAASARAAAKTQGPEETEPTRPDRQFPQR